MDKKRQLGQVFTPHNLANLMALLLLKNGGGDKESLLDPCVGENTFFKSIDELFPNNRYKITGVEIDKTFKYGKFFGAKNRSIQFKSFFELDIQEKFDNIIMNPPYIRQEELRGENSKEKINKLLGGSVKSLNKRSNLYVYFFLKTLQHLKPGGRVVAICYDSWLYTKYGDGFKEFLNNNFDLKTIIHFKRAAFADVNVGATILELQFSKIKKAGTVAHFVIEDAKTVPVFRNYSKLRSYLNKKKKKEDNLDHSLNVVDFFETIGTKYSFIRRGIETLANKMFYEFGNEKSKFVRPIVKNPKTISRYRIQSNSLGKIIIVKKEDRNRIEPSLRRYFKRVSVELTKDSDRYRALSEAIRLGNKDWFTITDLPSGNILFNYYFRNRCDFIYNPKEHFAANNFYILRSKDPFLDLSLLNSTLTKLAITRKARNQGGGLKKLQLYEFKNVSVIKTEKFTDHQKNELRLLGRELSLCSRGKEEVIIKKIDALLIDALYELTGSRSVINALKQDLLRFYESKSLV